MRMWRFWFVLLFGFAGSAVLRFLIASAGWLGIYIFFLLFLYSFLFLLLFSGK
jgi:hypothetical protein